VLARRSIHHVSDGYVARKVPLTRSPSTSMAAQSPTP